MRFADKRVPSYGPLDAQVVWLGESPGPQECEAMRPFVGPSGWEARKALRAAGIDDEASVRWMNCCPYMCLPWPQGKMGAELLDKWAADVNEELAQLTHAKVMVLCGGVPLLRMTGYTSISDWHGSLIKASDVAGGRVTWHKGITGVVMLPPTLEWLVPVLHPAGILKDPSRKQLPVLYSGVRRVGRLVRGELGVRRPVERFYAYEEMLDASV